MADNYFSNLMGGETPTKEIKYDFTGLMDAKKTEDVKAFTPTTYGEKVREAVPVTQKKIEDRGSVWSEYTPDTSIMGRVGTGLKTLALPFELAQSAIANPIIAQQQGQFSPWELAKESFKGLIGVKQGEYGDILRNLSAPEPVAATAGLAIDMLLPGTVLKNLKGARDVSRFSDPKLSNAIDKFYNGIKGGKGTLTKLGNSVKKVYSDFGGEFVDNPKLGNAAGKLLTRVKKAVIDDPNIKPKELEAMMTDIVNKGDVSSVWRLKQVVDDMISGIFNARAGKNVSQSQRFLMDSSRELGNLMDDAIIKSQKVAGKSTDEIAKFMKEFRKTRQMYSKTKNAFSSVTGRLVNTKTGQPTRTGEVLEEILNPREMDLRETLRALKKPGEAFKKDLRNIEEGIRFTEQMQRIKEGAAYGATVGTVLGQTVGRARESGGITEIIQGASN